MSEKYRRQIKGITGTGAAGTIIFRLPTDKRIHSATFSFSYAGGTNTVAGAATAISEIRVKVGTTVKWRLSGTQLRDWILLNGTGYDFTGVPNTGLGVLFYLPFAQPWFLASVADAMAANPQRLGGEISVEIDTASVATVTAWAEISDDINALSAGITTLEVLTPVAGGTAFIVEKELEPRGNLVQATFYPDSGGSNAITPVTVYGGSNDIILHEALTAAQNTELLNRFGLTPAASGRTANLYDVVTVLGDMLSHSWNMERWGSVKAKVEAGGAMSGTVKILVERLESK